MNDGPRLNTLHGGSGGFGACLWEALDGLTEVDGGTALTLTRVGFLPVDAHLIPRGGAAAPVAGTPFDFRTPTPVGARLTDPHPQMAVGGVGGVYDHCFVLRGGRTTSPRPVVDLHDPAGGRTMRIATTEPGLQLYLSSELDGTLVGSGGRPYEQYGGIVLETQHFPDSPNRPDYPSTLLLPGRAFTSTTVYEFGVQGLRLSRMSPQRQGGRR